MQPNQPYTPPPAGQNPYDFITNPASPPKKSLFSGGSFKGKVIVIVGGAIVVMVIIAIVTTLLTSGNQGNTSALKSMVAQQEELVRVADLGVEDVQDPTLRSLAVTTKLSVSTQQQKLISYLSERGIELTKEELAAQKDESVDSELETASSSNRFDDAFRTELNEQLSTYANALDQAYESANEQAKAILNESLASTTALLD